MDPKLGGVSQAVHTMIKGLAELGNPSQVVCMDEPNAVYDTSTLFPVYKLGPAKGPWIFSPLLIPWLLDNLNNYDFVILHGLWLYHGYALNKAMKILKKKNADNQIPSCLVMPHGMLDPYFQKAHGRKVKAIRNLIYWKLIESKVINQADGVLFTCESEKILAALPFKPYKPKYEKVIGLGIENPPAFTDNMRLQFIEKCPWIQDKPYILFISRIHEKKGVDVLIDAYLRILSENSLSSRKANSLTEFPKLVIAGPGLETSYGEMIKKKVDQSSILKEQIFFPGMLTGDAKWGAFYGCDAFILPSHQENFGIAVVEALSCSKSVLISDQVNIWHEIVSAEGGLVEKDNEEGTLNLLNNWIHMENGAKIAMNNNAKKAFDEQFSLKANALRLKKVFTFFERIS